MRKSSITFNNLTVNSTDTNSGIFIGSNYVDKWRMNEKENLGTGSIEAIGPGESPCTENANLIFDRDYLENPQWRN